MGCVQFKPVFFLPGSPSLWDISSKVSTSSSCGAWITITVDPSILNKHPIFPCKLSFSFKKKDDRMALRNKKGINKHGISNHLLIKLHVVFTVRVTCIHNLQLKNSYFLSWDTCCGHMLLVFGISAQNPFFILPAQKMPYLRTYKNNFRKTKIFTWNENTALLWSPYFWNAEDNSFFQRWTCRCVARTLLYHSHYVSGET